MLLQAKDDCHMIDWTLKRDYISPSIENEIVTKMGQAVLQEILGKIRLVYVHIYTYVYMCPLKSLNGTLGVDSPFQTLVEDFSSHL